MRTTVQLKLAYVSPSDYIKRVQQLRPLARLQPYGYANQTGSWIARQARQYAAMGQITSFAATVQFELRSELAGPTIRTTCSSRY